MYPCRTSLSYKEAAWENIFSGPFSWYVLYKMFNEYTAPEDLLEFKVVQRDEFETPRKWNLMNVFLHCHTDKKQRSAFPFFLLPAAPLCGHRCFAEWEADTTPHIYKSDSLNQYWTLRVLLRAPFTINISFPPYLRGWNWHFICLSLSLALQFKPSRGAWCLGSVKGPFRCVYVALAGVVCSEQIMLTRCRYCEIAWLVHVCRSRWGGRWRCCGENMRFVSQYEKKWIVLRSLQCCDVCLLLIQSAA